MKTTSFQNNINRIITIHRGNNSKIYARAIDIRWCVYTARLRIEQEKAMKEKNTQELLDLINEINNKNIPQTNNDTWKYLQQNIKGGR